MTLLLKVKQMQPGLGGLLKMFLSYQKPTDPLTENLQQMITEVALGLFGGFCLRISKSIRLISTWHAVFKALLFRICCTYTCFCGSTCPHVSLSRSERESSMWWQWAQHIPGPSGPQKGTCRAALHSGRTSALHGLPLPHTREASFLPPQTFLFLLPFTPV